MPYITSVGLITPPHQLKQSTTEEFAKELFQDSFKDINRLLKVFTNGNIESRYFAVPLDWFKEDHTFQEKNDLFIESALDFSVRAVQHCLSNKIFLKAKVDYEEIEAIFFVTSSGVSTPSIDAKLMNKLPFSPHTKRIPIWGLGCAGGASGLSRAYEYCKAFPKANVLVISVELCSLTFQRNDRSKSNLIGTSIFADGVACALISGNQSLVKQKSKKNTLPKILGTQSTLMPNSEDVMGWDVRNEGFHVIFSKDIPTIIESWLKPNLMTFLQKQEVPLELVEHFIAHPGGKKVLDAYVNALGIPQEKNDISADVLRQYGNMSSATVFYVLKEYMEKNIAKNDYGVVAALGPGFSSELLLLQWD